MWVTTRNLGWTWVVRKHLPHYSLVTKVHVMHFVQTFDPRPVASSSRLVQSPRPVAQSTASSSLPPRPVHRLVQSAASSSPPPRPVRNGLNTTVHHLQRTWRRERLCDGNRIVTSKKFYHILTLQALAQYKV